MIFNFTFSVPLPFRNPFASSAPPVQNPTPSAARGKLRPIPRPDLLNAEYDNSEAPTSNKRRREWLPSESTALAPPFVQRSTSKGVIGAGIMPPHEEDDQRDEERDHPAKRRKTTLTDSLLTSALNVALVSTAFGITAYRMWKGQPTESRDEVLDVPPPYEEGGWVHAAYPKQPTSPTKSSTSKTSSFVAPRRPRRQPRTHTALRRRPAFIAPAPPSTSSQHQPTERSCNTSQTFGISHNEEEDEDDMDRMDFMSAQLQALIAEGQKALGKEVVVSMDTTTAEDEGLEDDGDQGWDDEGVSYLTSDGFSSIRRSRSIGSGVTTQRRQRRASPTKAQRISHSANTSIPYTPLAVSQSMPPPSSFHQPFASSSTPSGGLYQSARPSFAVDEGASGRETTPDLQQAMQKVRRAYGLQ